MLSTTNTLNDTLSWLKPYQSYGYEETSTGYIDFMADVTRCIEDAALTLVIPVIGKTYYNIIQNYDKVNLSEKENYIYNSEICFSLYRFLIFISNREKQNNVITQQSGIGTFQQTFSDLSSKDRSADEYYRRAWISLGYAGYIRKIGKTVYNNGYYR